MEPVTLVAVALTLATPFLLKTGEKIAEGIGEDIWKLIKKPFSKKEKADLPINLKAISDKVKLTSALLEKINTDMAYKIELEKAVNEAQSKLNAYYQQNIHNNGQIGKQVNVQNITGDINL